MKLLFPLLLAIALFPAAGSAALQDDVQSLISEAEQMRALELSPQELSSAKSALAAKDYANAEAHARKAIENSLAMNRRYSDLIASRDRMQLAHAEEVRKDLTEHAEEAFSRVVAQVEAGNADRADKEAKEASRLTYQAEVVAAREQLTRPIVRKISEARKLKAREYAPKAYKAANEVKKQVESIISSDPAAQGKAVNLSKRSVEDAEHAMYVSSLGAELQKDPSVIETWVDKRKEHLRKLAAMLGVQVRSSQTPEEMMLAINQGVLDMKSNYEARLVDAEAQIDELSAKLGKYETDLADMAALRHKLQLKREAEEKIKRLVKLFDPNKVEVLLTPDADVILRMKAMNFRSGSAVIPPESFELLDLATQAIETFPDRAIRVEGHTDSMGANDYNQTLSERRSAAVSDYLKERMQGEKRTLESVGYGEEKPILNNETAAGRKANRRIDIVLIAPQADS